LGRNPTSAKTRPIWKDFCSRVPRAPFRSEESARGRALVMGHFLMATLSGRARRCEVLFPAGTIFGRSDCLVVKVCCEDIGEAIPVPSHRDASHVLCDLLGGARPVASDPALAMVPRRSRPLCGDHHLAGSRPHASGRALPWLHPTVGRSARAAAVNRPARAI
jgi:hypothetical protein